MKTKLIDTGVEALLCGALQRPAPYYAKIIDTIDNGKGYWSYLKVGIFQRPEADITAENYTTPQVSDTDVQIGEYAYNYSSVMRTFHPFQLRGKWYALYAKDYTSTRIMELPSCKDLGGEERDQWGFCPTDYWVPPLSYIESVHNAGCPRDTKNGQPDYSKPCSCTIVHNPECEFVISKGKASCNACADKWDEYYRTHHLWHFPDRVHGFVAGCVWGDDSSWKIQYLDLSRADEGIIKRDDRFDYIELPEHLTLDKAIDLDVDDDSVRLKIATESYYDLKTGKKSE